ncbi:MAG: PBP1A family penicillin-binding protein [Candidatus Eisenbacteria bacterium]|nr:PBP1A family penicillin-binding protein [Candidatus Eisenbacteria bacterium]
MLRSWIRLFVIVLAALVAGAVGAVLWLQRGLPSPSLLESVQPLVGATVYARDGRILHAFARENRVIVALDDVPAALVDAVVATEDKDFRSHWGVDASAIMRAAMRNVRAGRVVEGASTITQQLARSLFLTPEISLTRKLREALLALRIEQTYSKDRILELYLNQIYFGHGAYGVQAASWQFFGKHVSELDLAECALLAGLPKNPSGYSPRQHPNRALARRRLVLSLMAGQGTITREEAARADTAALHILPRSDGAGLGAYFVEHIRRELVGRYGPDALYAGGLRIYTTLDLDLQAAAERALENRLARLEREAGYRIRRGDATAQAGGSEFTPYVQGALLAVDAASGGIIAMVGGRDFRDSEFNRATQAPRQPGSGFKPFVYTAAIDGGYTPADRILDAPVIVPGAGAPRLVRTRDGVVEEPTDWIPENYEPGFRGEVTLRYALKHSINLPTVRLCMDLGPQAVVQCARQMGISTPIKPVYSIALGSSEVKVIDMVEAYATLDNHGIRMSPYAIERIEDQNGRILERHESRSREALSPETAYVVTSMLESVMVNGTGWAARAWGFDHPAAGKTGTTNDCTDAWFVGYTPRVVCGVWVGYDDRRSLGRSMTGAVAALPIWTEFMKAAHAGLPHEPFRRPSGVVVRRICAETGALATPDCGETLDEVFVAGTEPTEMCPAHDRGGLR